MSQLNKIVLFIAITFSGCALAQDRVPISPCNGKPKTLTAQKRFVQGISISRFTIPFMYPFFKFYLLIFLIFRC